MNLFEFSSAIREFVRKEQFEEALAFFKENKEHFSKEEIGSNPYIVSDILNCLRKTDNMEAAFRFLEIYDIDIHEHTPERVLQAYGWLLFFSIRKVCDQADDWENADEEEEYDWFHEATQDQEHEQKAGDSTYKERIIGLMPLLQMSDNPYSITLFSRLFSLVIKTEKKKISPDWSWLNELCRKINRERLSTLCERMTVSREGQEKVIELASGLEQYYVVKTSALLELKDFPACIEMCDEALRAIPSFHYSNDFWLTRRKFQAMSSTGQHAEALTGLLGLLQRKQEWFIQRDIAEIYRETGDVKQALTFASAGLINHGKMEYKVGLIELAGDLLQLDGNKELAYLHYCLAVYLRKGKEWKIPAKLGEKISLLEAKGLQNEVPDKLLKRLKEVWRTMAHASSRQQHPIEKSEKGVISKILHNNERGADGFIRSNNGEDLYFSISAQDSIKGELKEGLPVSFTIVDQDKGKKQRKAVRIKK